MSIGIVIPCYNAEKTLTRTVEGVLAQTVTDWELVLVDDGSLDRSEALARELTGRDPRIRAIHQENAGVSAARNAGFAHLRPECDCVIFLDADDVWEPRALETLRDALKSQPGAVAAHGLTRAMRDGPPDDDHCYLVGLSRNRRALGAGVLTPAQPTTFDVLVLENCIVTPGQVLMRSTAFVEAGQFDPAIGIAEDWDLWLRLSRLGVLAFADSVMLNYRVSGARNREATRAAERYVRGKMMTWFRDDPRRRRLITVGVAWRNCRDKAGYLRNHLARREFQPAARQVPAILGSFARCVQAYVRP